MTKKPITFSGKYFFLMQNTGRCGTELKHFGWICRAFSSKLPLLTALDSSVLLLVWIRVFDFGWILTISLSHNFSWSTSITQRLAWNKLHKPSVTTLTKVLFGSTNARALSSTLFVTCNLSLSLQAWSRKLLADVLKKHTKTCISVFADTRLCCDESDFFFICVFSQKCTNSLSERKFPCSLMTCDGKIKRKQTKI